MPSPENRSIIGFFESHYNPYYIYAPNYVHQSGGVRALHYLCHALNELGCEAYIAPATHTNPSLRTPILTPDTLKNHYLAGKTPIAVQPETYSSNFFQTPYVAHWLLNRPGHLAPAKSYADDLVFYFSEWVLPTHLSAEPLSIPLVDLTIFNNEDNPDDSKRELECYYAHKYFTCGYKVPQEMKKRAISLCQDIPRTPTEIAAILRNSKVIYCYEESAILVEALLCGCPALLIPSAYQNKQKWSSDWIPQGAAWADEVDDLEALRSQTNGFRENYETTHAYCWTTVQNFINTTHKAFTLKERKLENGTPPSATEQLWNIPKSQRSDHLDAFLQAYSKQFSSFRHWTQATPVLQLAHWLNENLSAYNQLIPHPKPSTHSITKPSLKWKNPEEEFSLLARVDKLLQAGKNEKVIPLLAQLVAHDTIRWEVYETLGQLYAEQEKLDEAASVLLRGASLEFTSTHCLRKLAAVYAMQGDLWRTLAACAQILKSEPDDAELHLFIRDVLLSTSPRFDNISWLAPEWNELIDTLSKYQSQVHSARSLLDSLANKVQEVLKEHHPLLRLGQPDAEDSASSPQAE